MEDGHLIGALSMPTDWAKDQWVMIYIFSDASADKYGFGAYAPGVGAEYFEKSDTGTFDMEGYVGGSAELRIGSGTYFDKVVLNARKMVVFKGTAIHSTSNDTIDDLLQSKHISHSLRHRLSLAQSE